MSQKRKRSFEADPDMIAQVLTNLFSNSICYAEKEIIERHQGKIWVENTEKTGVAFHFTLPIAGREEKMGEQK